MTRLTTYYRTDTDAIPVLDLHRVVLGIANHDLDLALRMVVGNLAELIQINHSLLLLLREDVYLSDAGLYLQVRFGELAKDAVDGDRACILKGLSGEYVPLPIEIAFAVLVYRRLELVGRIVRATCEFDCFFRLIIICDIIALTEHVVNRGVDHSREFLWEFLARTVFFFVLLAELAEDFLDLVVVFLQIRYLHLIVIDNLRVLLRHVLHLVLIDQNLLLQGTEALLLHIQPRHVRVYLIVQLLYLSLVVDNLIIE